MNRTRRAILVVALMVGALLPLFLKSYGIYLLTLLCVYLMPAFGLNLIVGYAGQMSIGQGAFYGIGAYIAALLMTKAGIPFWLVLPVAATSCFTIGLALGIRMPLCGGGSHVRHCDDRTAQQSEACAVPRAKGEVHRSLRET